MAKSSGPSAKQLFATNPQSPWTGKVKSGWSGFTFPSAVLVKVPREWLGGLGGEVDGGAKRVVHLPGGAGEMDDGARGRDLDALETVRLQPGSDGLDVMIGGA